MGNREAEKQSADARNVAPGLAELRQRVEAATGPDREIDCYVEAFVARHTVDGEFHIVNPPTYDTPRFFYNPMPSVSWIGYDLLRVSPAYTASLDAVLSLVGEKAKGWSVRLSVTEHGGHCNAVMGRSHPTNKTVAFDHHTLPLALLSALLAALDASEAEGPSAKNEDAA